MKLKYILLAIIPCIMIYYLALPFIEPSQEIMRCNEDYICNIEQQYLGYNKTKTIILDKDKSKIKFNIKSQSIGAGRSGIDGEVYKIYLLIIDKNNVEKNPFKKEFDYKSITYGLKTQYEIYQERRCLNISINNNIESSQEKFNLYLENPNKGFSMKSKASSDSVFAMYPIVLMFVFLGVGFYIIGKVKKII